MAKHKALSSGARSSGCPIIVFGLVFTLVGGGVFIGFTVAPFWRYVNAKTWPAVPCYVVSSEVGEHRGDDSTTYSPDITYTYEYEGRAYTSARYSFVEFSDGHGYAAAAVRRYPANSEAVCYVNPRKPEYAVLTRDFQWFILLGCFGLIFLLIGLVVMFGSSRARSKALSKHASFKRQAVEAPAEVTGALELRPSAPPWAAFIGLLIFAAVWNSIVGIVAFSVFFRQEGFSFAAVFFIPFILAGIGILLGAVYYLLACFNPRPRLTLTPGMPRLGQECSLEWVMLGAASRIRRFRLSIEGKESATYRQGTTTRTDTHVFLTVPLFETDTPADMRAGQIRFVFPEFTMHSFKANNNKIIWSFKAHGDIARWPDIQQEYEFTVLPLVPGA